MKILVSALLAILCVTVEAHAQTGGFVRNDALVNINGANLTVGSAAVDATGKTQDEPWILARSTEPTAVANGADVRMLADTLGKPAVSLDSIPDLTFVSCSGTATTTADTLIRAAPGAALRLYVTAISCVNNSAVQSQITFKDGAATIWLGAAPTAASGGGYSITFKTPIRFTANTAFNFAMATTATSTTCCAAGYTSSL